VLVADLPARGTRLSKANVVRVGGGAAADETRSRGDRAGLDARVSEEAPCFGSAIGSTTRLQWGAVASAAKAAVAGRLDSAHGPSSMRSPAHPPRPHSSALTWSTPIASPGSSKK
jgi:hypothetical protein